MSSDVLRDFLAEAEFRYGRGNRAHSEKMGDITIYYSYQTPIGYYAPEEGTVLRQNVWGKTTGGHLNILGPKEGRLTSEEFEKRLHNMLAKHGLRLSVRERWHGGYYY